MGLYYNNIMKISFGNQFNNYKDQYNNMQKDIAKFNDFVYNVADPPINMLLRYEFKPNQIKNDWLRNSINTASRTQAEAFSMMYNPMYLTNKLVHISKTIDDTKHIAKETKSFFDRTV